MTDNVLPNEKLSLKKSRALAAVLFHATLEDAARSIGISTRTLSRWLADPEFQQALTRAESEAITLATRRLVILASKAIATLEAVLDDKKSASGVKVRASAVILDYLLRLRESVSLENRVSELERKANL